MINVVYPFDNNYAPYAGVSITSLLINNITCDEINIYILDFGIDEVNKYKICSTVEKYGRKVFFLSASSIVEKINALNMPAYRNANASTARLFLPMLEELADVGRIIHMDSDTIVTGSVEDLFSCELDGHPLGMVMDSVASKYKLYLGFSKEERYYNTGIMLYDINTWRQKRCTERIVDHVRNVRNNYMALDQDLVNIVLRGDIVTLPIEFNVQPFHFAYNYKAYRSTFLDSSYYSENEIKWGINNPRIVHSFRFIGEFPWHLNNVHPNSDLFDLYLAKTEWDDYKKMKAQKNVFFFIEKLLFRILPSSLFLKLFRLITNITNYYQNRHGI